MSDAAPDPAGDGTATEVKAARRRLLPADRRAQIVTAGAVVFTTRGYQGTSLEDIAASIGVTRPLIYRYFRDKDALYREILLRARAELNVALVAAVVPTDPPADQLRAGLAAYFTFVRDRGQEWDLLFGGGTAIAGAVAEEAARLRFETADMIASLVRAAAVGINTVTAAAYAHAISGAAEQLAKWWRQNPDVPLDVVIENHLDVVWRGLARFIPEPGA